MSVDDLTQNSNGEENPVPMEEGGSESAGNGHTNGAAPAREDDRKLFVGGMARETTESDLKEYFSKFGEVEKVALKMDYNTGVSRGFAFVVLKDLESTEKALAASEHVIGGKKTEVNRAKARQGKVFVGGLSPDVSEEKIREYFGKYGKIVELEMPFDKMRNQRKGFIFVTYETEDSMKEILKNPRQTVGDKEVEIKKATPKADMPMPGRGGMRGGPRGGFVPRGGRGGGRGGGWGGQEYGGGYGGGYGGYGGSGGYADDGYGGDSYGGYGGGYGSGGYGGYNGGYGGGNYGPQGGQYGPQKTRGGPRGRGGQRYAPYNRH